MRAELALRLIGAGGGLSFGGYTFIERLCLEPPTLSGVWSTDAALVGCAAVCSLPRRAFARSL
jgi:hypothetical protein